MIVLLRSIPGGGKTTWIKEFKKRMSSTILEIHACSADDYMVTPDGIYDYSAEKIPLAHKSCFLMYLTLVQQSKNDNSTYIIVDNTNITALELAPYVRIAEVFDHPYEIKTLYCDPAVAAFRCIHPVSTELILKRHAQLLEEAAHFPSWWNHSVIFTEENE